MTQPEARIVRIIKAYLESRGARVFKIHGGDNPFQEAGIPDLIVCYQGQFIGLEVKIPGNKPSPIQRTIIKQIKASGGIAAVVYSIEDVALLLDSAVPPAVAGWIAGFFDGEGCCYLHQSRYPRITITQKDSEPLIWIQEVLGMGRIVYRKGRNQAGNLRAPYLSITKRDEVIRFIDLVSPHIRLRHRREKLEEARIMLARSSSISSSRTGRT